MKLTYLQLRSHLQKNLAPLYFIAGEEWWLKQDAIKLISQAAKKHLFEEKISLTVDSQFDWAHLYTSLFSSSLLAEKRIIKLNLNDTLPNKIGSDILLTYATKPVSDNLLIIEIGKLNTKITKTAWFQALEKLGIVVTIWPISREQLPQWIIERAKKYKLQIREEIAILITDYVEGNLVAAAQFIEKLYLLQPVEPIDASLINQIAINESSFTIFDLTDNLITGNKTRSLHILQQLQSEQVEPILILWNIARELRLLASLALQLSKGQSLTTLFEKNRIFSHRQNIIRQFLATHQLNHCLQYLSHAADIDKIVKGTSPGNIWDALQLFCLRIL